MSGILLSGVRPRARDDHWRSRASRPRTPAIDEEPTACRHGCLRPHPSRLLSARTRLSPHRTASGAPADGAHGPVPGAADHGDPTCAGGCPIRGRVRRGRRRRRPRCSCTRPPPPRPRWRPAPISRSWPPTRSIFSDAPAPTSQDALLPARLKGGGTRRSTAATAPSTATSSSPMTLQAAYPELVKVITYGETYTEDNDLRVVCVTADADQGLQAPAGRGQGAIPVRGAYPRPRAHHQRDDLADDDAADRRVRAGRRHHRAARRDRDLDRPADQPGRHRARSRRASRARAAIHLPAQEHAPGAVAAADLDRHRPQPQLRQQQLGRRRLGRQPVRRDLPRCVSRRPSRRPTTCRT